MVNRKGKFKVKNGSGSYDQVMLETQLDQVVDSPIKSLERSTHYEQNDIVAEQTCKGTFLVCTTAGTTAASAPSGYSSVAEGGSVTDGTAVFTAHRFNNLANIAAIIAHNALETAHPSLDFIKSLSAASDGIHYRTRNGKSDQVLDLINQLQATLSPETVPSDNTGSLATLLSGIVHQIAALSGKSNWWETPKDSFETLSAGVVAGDVSNPDSWWVKLGGTIPVIIQGGTTQPSPITFPVSFASKCLTVVPQLQAPRDTGNMSKNRVCVTNLTARGFGLENPQSAYNYIAIGI
nr:MAG TPA: putative tail fiber protein [Caudoviricetes sp.]